MRYANAKTKALRAAMVFAAIAVCGPAQADGRDAEERAIRARDAQWSADLGAGNLDAVMRNYADDAAFLVPNRPIIVGKQAIREWFEARLATPGYHAKFAPTRIVVSTSLDMAYELGTFEVTTTGADGRPVVGTGKHLVTWEKRDGAWYVMAEAISSDTPPSGSPR